MLHCHINNVILQNVLLVHRAPNDRALNLTRFLGENYARLNQRNNNRFRY